MIPSLGFSSSGNRVGMKLGPRVSIDLRSGTLIAKAPTPVPRLVSRGKMSAG